jgi:hypothetical protein
MSKYIVYSISYIVLISLYSILSSVYSPPALAQQNNISCPNRYVTLINPVRGRDLWLDKSLKPIEDQEKAVASNNFAATWLLQDNVFSDPELLSTIKSFPGNQEKGIFLEVSANLADQAGVYYPIDVPWFSPKAVFLSGYSQSNRRALIDTLFKNFKTSFGYYPKSVGAWWIDSYSLNYLQQKYGVTAAMIVADQKTTDSYGVWGQWWGVPYYPSKANILTPASSLADKQNMVVLQWAQRDPVLAYGAGPSVSNYSLQANDYIRQGKDANYFKDISSVYLSCQNPIGQITVGLETGQESLDYLGEYQNQLSYLRQSNISAVTMSQFAEEYSKIYPTFPKNITLSYQNTRWNLTTQSRQNKSLGDFISYQSGSSFSDYFKADTSNFLSRDLSVKPETRNSNFFPWYLVLIFLSAIFFYFRKKQKFWLGAILFSLLSYGVILRSTYQFGWEVFYGPVVSQLALVQAALVLAVFGAFYLLTRFLKVKSRFFIFYPSLGFVLSQILTSLRYTQISGVRYLGFLIDPFHFLGLGISHSVSLMNRSLPNYQAAALLKLDLHKTWQKPVLWILVFPLANLLVGLGLGYLLSKLPKKMRLVLSAILVLLLVVYLNNVFGADPSVVQ